MEIQHLADRRMRYRAADDRAEEIEAALRAKVVGRHDAVALVLHQIPRSPRVAGI
jgi:acyl-CoA synthetase (AMP-forming)/AMP-acid ligase II